VAAEVLGCALSRVRVVAADTDLTPIDIGSYSSRVTMMAGNATLRAAEEIRKQIASTAAQKMSCAPEELVFRDDKIERRTTTSTAAGEGARATKEAVNQGEGARGTN